MTEAPGGSAGFGHGSDPGEHEALLRRIREFLRHGAAAEAGVEEWGEFAAQLRFLREELPPEERALLGQLLQSGQLNQILQQAKAGMLKGPNVAPAAAPGAAQ